MVLREGSIGHERKALLQNKKACLSLRCCCIPLSTGWRSAPMNGLFIRFGEVAGYSPSRVSLSCSGSAARTSGDRHMSRAVGRASAGQPARKGNVLATKAVATYGQRHCLSHEDSGNTRPKSLSSPPRQWKHTAKAVSSPPRQWKHTGKGTVSATKTVETHGEGGFLATKAVETHGKGGVFATKAVETYGQRHCLSHQGSRNTRPKSLS